MDIKNIILIAVAVGNFAVCVWVFCRDYQRPLNWAYCLFGLGIIAWTTALIFFRLSTTPESALQWARLLYLAPVGIVVSFVYLCSRGFFSEQKLSFREKMFWLTPSVLMLVLIPWPNVLLQEIIIRPFHEKLFIFGWGYILYFFYIPAFFAWGYWLLYKRFYSENRNLIKRQFKFLFWGFVTASVGGMFTNLFLVTFGVTDYNWVGPIFTFAMLFLFTYAMKKYFLMHSKASACVILDE